MSDPIRLAISTCPNDTFAFHALLNQLVSWRGLNFEFELLDIDQLNQGAFAGQYDVAKISFHAALHLMGEYIVLPSGSALGFGVGPLLLAARPNTSPMAGSIRSLSLDSFPIEPVGNATALTRTRVLCPGKYTTAALLYQLFYPNGPELSHVVFSEIMPQLGRGEADFGVCIHEGRFTWQAAGLHLVSDLGAVWEQATQTPLPLGGILVKRALPLSTQAKIQSIIFESLTWARSNPQAALESMRKYAQEFDDRVLMQHVELYVNDWTLHLGPLGQRALDALSQMAKNRGLIPPDCRPLEIWNDGFSKA